MRSDVALAASDSGARPHFSRGAEHCGEDEARRLVRAGVEEFRDNAGNEADNDEPENTHRPSPECVCGRETRRVELWFPLETGSRDFPAAAGRSLFLGPAKAHRTPGKR